jgi:hypothetical protein
MLPCAGKIFIYSFYYGRSVNVNRLSPANTVNMNAPPLIFYFLCFWQCHFVFCQENNKEFVLMACSPTEPFWTRRWREKSQHPYSKSNPCLPIHSPVLTDWAIRALEINERDKRAIGERRTWECGRWSLFYARTEHLWVFSPVKAIYTLIKFPVSHTKTGDLSGEV